MAHEKSTTRREVVELGEWCARSVRAQSVCDEPGRDAPGRDAPGGARLVRARSGAQLVRAQLVWDVRSACDAPLGRDVQPTCTGAERHGPRSEPTAVRSVWRQRQPKL